MVDAVLKNGGDLQEDLVGYERAYSLIRSALSPGGKACVDEIVSQHLAPEVFVDLGLVAQEVTYANILAQAPLEPYFSIAHTLRDALRQCEDIPALSLEHPGWHEAVSVAASYCRNQSKGQLRISQPTHKDVTFANAVLYFTEKGINLPLVGDTISLSPDESRRFASTVYRPLMSMGDVVAMKSVEDLLSLKFDGQVKRLHLHPTPDMMGQKMDRSIPYGYLYRIALKTLGRERTNLSRRAVVEKVVVACTNLGAVFNVEPFSQYEMMFAPRPGKVLEVLREIIVYDELFTVPQSDPELAGQVVYNLFGEINIDGKVGWSTQDALMLYKVLQALTQDFVKSTFIKKSELLQHLSARMGVSKAEKLVQCFALGPVNSSYELPAHALQAETRECTLVRASKGRYWIPGQLFLGPAFYNRMVAIYSGAIEGVGGVIGKAFERHFEKRVKDKGITYLKGDYGTRKKRDGDVDLVIQTDDTILLFELKKKNLRRATFGGSDLQLAIDLSQGLVHGVNQLARQELCLMKNGRITFQDGAVLEWSGRKILKVVLSVFDYGGLHETVVVHHALRSLCGSSLSARLSITEEQKKSLDDANLEFKLLGENFARFKLEIGGDERVADGFFGNIRFFDIFFMERVLSVSRNAEELVKALSMAGRMVTGRRDSHFDFEYIRNIAKP